MAAPTILTTIVAHKRSEIAARQAQRPLATVQAAAARQTAPRGFAAALTRTAATQPAIIAEIKRGSPSLGCIRADLDATSQALAYAQGGAAALSVLTDERFFFGHDRDFTAARAAVSLPLLRKEFLIDPYQVYESRALGADCVLLILSILSDAEVTTLGRLAHTLGMDILLEAHDEAEVRRAVAGLPGDLLGINNRNLNNFHTDGDTALRLAGLVPDPATLVAESGLHSADAVARYWRTGTKRFLIGEAFVRSADPAATVRQFVQAGG